MRLSRMVTLAVAVLVGVTIAAIPASADDCSTLEIVFKSLGYTAYNQSDIANCCTEGQIPTGVTCINGTITQLELRSSLNPLTGSIPDSIGNLVNLQYLLLDGNQLTGSIPDSIGRLTNLHLLYLSYNNLTGSIPDSIGNLSKLTELHLNNNQLNGSIPDSIGNLTNLGVLYLAANQLNRLIPLSVSNLRQLTILHLENNQLTGSVPDSIISIQWLYNLDLSNNQLNGSIPESIGTLTTMQYLYLSDNQLTGSIPDSIGNLTGLYYLELSNNHLTGSIPDSIGNLNQLNSLYLGSNNLNGSIPDSIRNLNKLHYLDLSNNQLEGPIPDSIGIFGKLMELHLGNNLLTGSIPDSIGNLTGLTILTLNSNKLNGSIPDSIGNLTQLQFFNLQNNQLSRSIPDSIRYLNQLYQLYLDNNQLTGSIPDSIGNLTQLRVLHLDNNQLTGSIPYSIGNITRLQTLNISENHLGGVIPASICNLTLASFILNVANDGNTWVNPPIPSCLLRSGVAITIPTPSPSVTPSSSPSLSVTPSSSPSPSVTPSSSPSPSPSPSSSVTPSITPSTTITPSITPSTTITPSITPSITPTLSVSPSVMPSASVTPLPSIGSPELAALAVLRDILDLTNDYNTTAYGRADFCSTTNPVDTGITCDSGSIISMNFTGGVGAKFLLSLAPYLPAFTKLETLIIRNNPNFQVDLSQCDFFQNMTSLKVLDLSDNQFIYESGSNALLIPAYFGMMPNLRELRLSNQLNINSIPSTVRWLADSSNLIALDLQNMFTPLSFVTSGIADQLANMAALQTLILGVGHRLPSNIPENRINSTILNATWSYDWLLNLNNLVTLDLNNLNLNIPIPEAIFESMPYLEYLDLAGNGLLYSPPSSIFTLYNLSYLNLQNNLLTSISVNFNALLNLIYLNLNGNLLSGNIPTSLLVLKNLQYIDLSNNAFSGNFPFFTNAESLKILSIANNSFSGSLPSSSSSNSLAVLFAAQNIFECNASYSMIPNAALQFGPESFAYQSKSLLNKETLPKDLAPVNVTRRGRDWYYNAIIIQKYGSTSGPVTDYVASNDSLCCKGFQDQDGSIWPTTRANDISTSLLNSSLNSSKIQVPLNELTGQPIFEKYVFGQCSEDFYSISFRKCGIVDGKAAWQPRQRSCIPCTCGAFDGICSSGENGDGTCVSCFNPLRNGSLCQNHIPFEAVIESVPSLPIRIVNFSPIDQIDFRTRTLSVIFSVPVQLFESNSSNLSWRPSLRIIQNGQVDILRQVIYSDDVTSLNLIDRTLIVEVSPATFNQANVTYSVEIDAGFVINPADSTSLFSGLSSATNGLSWSLITPINFGADYTLNANDIVQGSISLKVSANFNSTQQQQQLFLNLSETLANAAAISPSRIPTNAMNLTRSQSGSFSIFSFQIMTINSSDLSMASEKSAVAAAIDLQILFVFEGSAIYQGSVPSDIFVSNSLQTYERENQQRSLVIVSTQSSESISYAIFIFLAVVIIIILVLHFQNPDAKNMRVAVLFVAGYSFVTRCIFLYSLFYSNQFVLLAIIAVALLVVAAISNYMLITLLLAAELIANNLARDWFAKYQWTTAPWIILGGVNSEIAAMISSKIMKWKILSAPLRDDYERRLQLAGFLYVILVDIPFFALQVYIIVANGAGVPLYTLLSLIASSMMILYGIVNRAMLLALDVFQSVHEEALNRKKEQESGSLVRVLSRMATTRRKHRQS